MLRKTVFLSLAALLAVLGATSEAQAWGAYHVGYTHVGPGGAYHYGRTEVASPYGRYYGGRTVGYDGYGGASRYGYETRYGGGYSSEYRTYGGYSYGGSYGGVRAGVYRAW